MLDINAFHNELQKAEKYVISALQILTEIRCPNDILIMTEDGVDGLFGETPLEITKCSIEIERGQRQAASSRLAKYLSSFVGNPHHVTHVLNGGWKSVWTYQSNSALCAGALSQPLFGYLTQPCRPPRPNP
jgi:hypothetical protein